MGNVPYAVSVAPDQSLHPHSLDLRANCPLTCKPGLHELVSSVTLVRLHGCAVRSGAYNVCIWQVTNVGCSRANITMVR